MSGNCIAEQNECMHLCISHEVRPDPVSFRSLDGGEKISFVSLHVPAIKQKLQAGGYNEENCLISLVLEPICDEGVELGPGTRGKEMFAPYKRGVKSKGKRLDHLNQSPFRIGKLIGIRRKKTAAAALLIKRFQLKVSLLVSSGDEEMCLSSLLTKEHIELVAKPKRKRLAQGSRKRNPSTQHSSSLDYSSPQSFAADTFQVGQKEEDSTRSAVTDDIMTGNNGKEMYDETVPITVISAANSPGSASTGSDGGISEPTHYKYYDSREKEVQYDDLPTVLDIFSSDDTDEIMETTHTANLYQFQHPTESDGDEGELPDQNLEPDSPKINSCDESGILDNILDMIDEGLQKTYENNADYPIGLEYS